jgi:hypothetical protein
MLTYSSKPRVPSNGQLLVRAAAPRLMQVAENFTF